MKKIVFLVLLGMAVFFKSCISFNVQPPSPVQEHLEEIVICKGVKDVGDTMVPEQRSDAFSNEDKHVLCFLKMKDISERSTLQWIWYSPQRKKVKDTGKFVVNQDERYLDAVTAYDKLNLGKEKETTGKWTVVIFFNNHFLGKESFLVKSKKQ